MLLCLVILTCGIRVGSQRANASKLEKVLQRFTFLQSCQYLIGAKINKQKLSIFEADGYLGCSGGAAS